ncbi:MAG: PAS domain S-box protein, partial [Chloroflexota bacterium]
MERSPHLTPPDRGGEPALGAVPDRAIVDTATDAIVTARDDGTIVAWNPAAARMFGYEAADAIGRPVSILMPEDHAQGHHDGMERFRATADRHVVGSIVEVSGRHMDGTTFPLELSLSEWETPDAHFATAIIRDATRRTSADEQLRESEAKYRALIETTGTGYLVLDWRGRVVDANNEYLRLSGHRTLDEILGRSVVEWTAEHDLQRNTDAVAQCGRDGSIRDLVIDYVDSEGRITPVEISATVVGTGESTRILSICRDVTQRKAAELALQTLQLKVGSQDLYSVLVEMSSEGFWLLDRSFNTLFVNTATEAMLGYTKAEMLGRSWYDFGDPAWVARAQELEKRREAGVNEPHPFLFVRKDGTKVLTRIATTALYDADGTFDGALGVLSDIGRQQEAEAALRVKDMLDSIATSSGFGMSLVNPDHTLAWANGLLATWFGETEIVGRNCFEVFEGRDSICPGCPALVTLKTGEVAVVEHAGITTSAGTGRSISMTTSPIRGASGQVLQVVEIAQDVTERNRAGASLRASEERYRTLFESASDAVFVIDTATTRILDANSAASALYGYDHDELLALNSTDLSAEPEETSRRTHAAGASPDQDLGVPRRLHRRDDGTVFPVEISARMIEWGEQRVLLVACRDVTGREAAEAAIRQMALLLDVAPNSITVHGLDGRFLYANPSTFEMHGYSRDEFMALNLAHVDATADATLVPAWMAELRDQGEAAFEAEHRRKDGSILPLAVTVTRTTWDDHEAILSVATDMTERRQVEATLESSRAELAEAQRIAHVGSWALDPASGSVTWSDEMLRIFGFPPGSPVPPFAEQAQSFTPESFARVTGSIEAAIATGEPFSTEDDIVRPDGTARRVAVDGEAVRDAAGSITGLRGTVADVTELRVAQARLDQSLRAEMVGRLAGGIAHDFNNVLAAVGGYAQLLAASLPAGDPRLDDVRAIQDAGDRAAALTRQLLAFGRRQALQPTVLDPGEVVSGLAPMLRSLVPASVELVLPAGSTGALVRVDRAGLEQAVVNLALNARDAMPAGGTLTVETLRVAIAPDDQRLRSAARPGPFVQITVTDTGTGIDPAILPHVFEPFLTTKAFGKGSGLGLSSVDGFIAQSG